MALRRRTACRADAPARAAALGAACRRDPAASLRPAGRPPAAGRAAATASARSRARAAGGTGAPRGAGRRAPRSARLGARRALDRPRARRARLGNRLRDGVRNPLGGRRPEVAGAAGSRLGRRADRRAGGQVPRLRVRRPGRERATARLRDRALLERDAWALPRQPERHLRPLRPALDRAGGRLGLVGAAARARRSPHLSRSRHRASRRRSRSRATVRGIPSTG